MKLLSPLAITTFASFLFISTSPVQINLSDPESLARPATPVAEQKIQAAILLDVSGSMNGLIEQAKAQLWNMVSVMGRVKCQNGIPKIEIALYEYGRTNNDVKAGYIKQISPFTNDLDKLSAKLFELTTNGGDEYCGQVIYKSLEELNWDSTSGNYKVIFIAGNEDFLQGSVHYNKACKLAQDKGVIVNTIYCGPREQGIREHWNLSGECGQGNFTNIDHNADFKEIATPYDSVLFSLNTSLNNTYVYYGASGYDARKQQERMDVANAQVSQSAGLKRVVVKGNSSLYYNSSWDLVDAVRTDSTILTKIDKNTLPENLKNKSISEIKSFVQFNSLERGRIQQRIATISVEREKFIVNERSKTNTENTQTLETEVERIIKDQVKRYNMVVE